MKRPIQLFPSIALLALLFLLLVLGAGAALADGFCHNAVTPCDQDDPRSPCYIPPPPNPQCEPLDCDKCTRSPCYAATGVYVSNATDLHLDTRSGPIDAARFYQSSQAIDGDTGFGWISSLSAHLYATMYLKAAPSTYERRVLVRMPSGALYTFRDAGSGTFTAPYGRFDVLTQNGDGSFDLRLQRSRTVMHFDATGKLVSIADPYGNAQTWTYAGDRLARVADATGSGRYIDVTWGADGRISDLTDVAGRTVHYAYDSRGVLVAATNPLAQTTQYAYTNVRFAPLLTSITDPWGRNITTISYDYQGRAHGYTDQGETYTYTYGYQNSTSQTSKLDSAGNLWKFVYDANGLVTEAWAPGATVPMKTIFDNNGLLVTKIDQLGVKTSATYNAEGNPLTATFDDGGPGAVRFQYVYDTNYPEQLVSVSPYDPATGQRNPNWQTKKFDYYPPGSVAPGALHNVYEVESDGVTAHAIITYTYDARGRVVSVADAGGNSTDYAYDTHGNVITVSAPSNNDAGTRPQTSYTYDLLGRVTSKTDGDGRTTTYAWDALGRTTSVTLPKPSPGSPLDFTTTYHYDEFDSQAQLLFTRVIDPLGHVSKTGYDADKRPLQNVGIAGDIIRNQFTRGLLTSQWDGENNRTAYDYDALRRLTKITYPDTTFTGFQYNADDTIASRRNRKGQTITYTYDHFKRLTAKTYPNGSSVNNIFLGQKLQQVNDTHVSPGEVHTFAYDSSFRNTENVQAGRGTVRYTYDANRRLASREVVGGATTTLGYYPDASIRTMTWSPLSGNFKYDYSAAGLVQKITFPNGQTREYTYDGMARMTQLANRHPVAGDLAVFSYGYDLDPATGLPSQLGLRTSVTTTIPALSINGALTTFGYDNRELLSTAIYPASAPFNGLTQSWTYDSEGNRKQAVINGTPAAYAYQLTRLTSDGGNNYTYDPAGNLTARSGSRGNVTFGYDEDDRLTTISGGVTASYAYDYLLRRTGKTAGGTSSTYLYDDVHAIADTSGGVTTEYLFGPGYDEALAMVRAGVVSYFDPDAMASVAAVNDSAGTVLNAYAWDAWGAPIASTETVPSSIVYAGREKGEAGLLYFRNRSYEPDTGRFTTEDPDFFVGGLNTYLYAWAKPLIFNDPLGLSPHVQVCAYLGSVGHIGASTETRPTLRGFYPVRPGRPFDDGIVKPDDPNRPKQCVMIPATPQQQDCFDQCMDAREANPGRYNVLTRQCTGLVRDCLTQCDLPHGVDHGAVPYEWWITLPGTRAERFPPR